MSGNPGNARRLRELRDRMPGGPGFAAAEDEFWRTVKVQDGAGRTEAERLAELRRLREVAIVHRLSLLTEASRIPRCGARTK